MALSSSGAVSASQIANEFGYTTGNSSISLGGYRTISGGGSYPQTVGELSFPSIDGGGSVATSGQITMGSFRGTKLQTVVNFWSDPIAGGPRLIARDRYNSNGIIDGNVEVATIGGYKSRPSSSSGTKVHIHVKQFLDNVSTQGQSNSLHDQRTCAFRTGSWESGTDLQIDVANGGRIQGAGGWGGQGGSPNAGAGGNGGAGTSGLGVQYNGTTVKITGSGVISAGYGGGGGGGGAYDSDRTGFWGRNRRPASGGGGGGGAGRPGGAGNIPGSGGTSGANGGNALNDGETFGEGGGGGNNDNEAIGGTGGDGGSRNELSDAGGNGVGGEGAGAGGGRGPTGAAIRRNSGISVTIVDSGNSLNGRGSTTATGVL